MIQTKPLPTHFAPPERTPVEIRTTQTVSVSGAPFVESLLSAIPFPVVILNQQREIVHTNQAFLTLLGAPDVASVAGQRVGEAVNCEHAFEMPGGCGTSRFCSTCGAVQAMLSAQKGTQMTEECRLTAKSESGEMVSFDLRVTAVPQNILGDQFTVFTINDISNEKRRRILERIFFHDITNTAGAIHGLAEIMTDMTSLEELEEFCVSEMLNSVSSQLIDEIQAQRQLLAAENGELSVDVIPLNTQNILQDLLNMYKNHMVAEDKALVLDSSSANIQIATDRALLARVVGNMIKNALEASSPQQTVTVGCHQVFDFCRIWVHNTQVIPQRVQLQIFNRSFSTKGNGRGLGTYSMKLLTENYLQGRISFESTPEQGTVFSAMIPLEWCEPITKNSES